MYRSDRRGADDGALRYSKITEEPALKRSGEHHHA